MVSALVGPAISAGASILGGIFGGGKARRAKRRAAEAQAQRDQIRNTTREINTIKSEMHEIKHLLKQLVSKE